MNVVKLISEACECNINQFMSCAFKDDFSVLIVSGKPSPKELQQAWENILTEFNDLSGQSAPMDELVLMRQIAIMKARMKAFEMTVFAHEQGVKLCNMPVITNFNLFTKYGYEVTWRNDVKDYLNQLQTIRESEQAFLADIHDLEQQLETLQKEDKKIVSTSSRTNFLRQIKNIEIFHKIQIDFDKYSVERLAILISDFRTMVENQKENSN